MSETQQLDVSLTSMDWLSRLQVNKVGSNTLEIPNNSAFGKLNNQPISSSIQNESSHHSDSLTPLPKLPENTLIISDVSQKKSTTLETNSVPLLKTIPINSTPTTISNNSTIIQIPSVHSVAQRAEPNRPVDLSAEYKGTDYNRRDGKPPYSYVTTLILAI